MSDIIPHQLSLWQSPPTHNSDYKIEFICETCSKPFLRDRSRVKHGRGKHCSPKCQYEAMKARPPKAKTVTLTCINCNHAFTLYQSTLKSRESGKGAGKYCSRECRDEHRTGEQHPQWLGGEPYKRGPNWQAQRRKAMKRDNHTCQHCGNPGEHVHHKVPFRFFGIERCKEANRLSNLITLCEPCHRKADAAIQRAG